MYDTENRPTQISTRVGVTAPLYDGDGGRVRKTTGTAITTYIGKLYECTNGLCDKYIFAGDQRIAMKRVGSGVIHYYHADHLGSSSVVTDATGAKVQNLAYFPFGQTRQQSGTVNVHHKYAGQELDDSTGLYFYNARYYDPVLGRFMSADTVAPNLRDPQDINRYTYAGNDPLLYTDPTGQRGRAIRSGTEDRHAL